MKEGVGWRENLLIVAGAMLVTGVVYASAWVSDDCFITLRYVSNTVQGYGPVFNVGERVQGYTHPAWFLLLVAGSLVFRDPVLVAFGYSFLFTFLAVVVVGRALFRLSPNWYSGASVFAVTGLVWCLSDPWVSFQTSGLENSLAHFLLACIVSETWILSARRSGRLMLLVSLLCLTRPDFVVLIMPLAILLLCRVRTVKQVSFLILGAVPVLAWLSFAAAFYHDIIPNTFYAKVGNYESIADAIHQGLAYIGDWFHYDTLAAGSTVLFFALAAWKARTVERIALLVGIAMYVVWIIQVGGDFMRGRFFMPVFTASVFAGGLALVEQARESSKYFRWEFAAIVCVLVGLSVIKWLNPEPPIDVEHMMIVNERNFYSPGFTLSHYLEHGSVEGHYITVAEAQALRKYAEKCGPITFHSQHPGTIGYLSGPKVSIIDELGLTDAYIAKLPRESLIKQNPRPGHALKLIPMSYLISRNDIALLPQWGKRITEGDCTLRSDVKNLNPSSE